MRMVDLRTKRQITGLSLFVTRADALQFLDQLRDFNVTLPGPESRRTLVDSGEDEGQANYATRRIVLLKYDSKRGGEQGWPAPFQKLILDDPATLRQVDVE
ncbi:MAG: hypothetical protein HZB26_11675 [Candidatus Hydrogenedentes bacterium]|nr:hypothetical protein [Candidatus Hydrogenedentota bacterium]